MKTRTLVLVGLAFLTGCPTPPPRGGVPTGDETDGDPHDADSDERETESEGEGAGETEGEGEGETGNDDDGASETGSTDDAPAEPECDPEAPSDDGCLHEGVFVATHGDDDDPGTKDAPMATLGAAIQRAATGSHRVYACAEDFIGDTIVVTGDVQIFGGLDCDDTWQWIGDERRTRYVANNHVSAMKIAGRIDVAIEDFEIVGGTAFVAGGSSIGVVVHGATRALFRRSHVAAGDAQPGADAIVDHTHAATGSAGADGLASDCVPVDTQMFGSGGVNEVCPAGAGGHGGGLQEYGEPGSPASVGGEGGELNTYAGACTEGGVGLDGAEGDDGVGARGLGVLDLDGWVAATADAGTAGAVGGGGGGGGGGLPPAFTCTVSDVDIEFDILAPGGGGGGAGGCGGAGGAAGGSGGSSIAIVSIDANVVLESTTLATRDGGDGGTGAAGQAGGDGGAGGIGGDPIDPGPYGGGGVGNGTCAAAGGDGGAGGRGGTGGGGAGGHALGVAYRGSAPALGFGVEFSLGVAGAAAGTSASRGDDGVAAETLAIE